MATQELQAGRQAGRAGAADRRAGQGLEAGRQDRNTQEEGRRVRRMVVMQVTMVRVRRIVVEVMETHALYTINGRPPLRE